LFQTLTQQQMDIHWLYGGHYKTTNYGCSTTWLWKNHNHINRSSCIFAPISCHNWEFPKLQLSRLHQYVYSNIKKEGELVGAMQTHLLDILPCRAL